MSYEILEIVKERFDSSNIKYEGYDILIAGHGVSFNGISISGDIKLSEDEEYVRFLVPTEDEMTADIYYKSTEFHIKDRFSTFLPYGEMDVNSDIFILE